MRIISLAILIIIGLTSCTRTVKIPENKVGIVYDIKTKDVVDRVFESGKHSISTSSDIALFDTTDQKLNFSFDILFKDATSAVIDFSILYKLRVGNLPRLRNEVRRRPYVWQQNTYAMRGFSVAI